jgi:hypothetical protein
MIRADLKEILEAEVNKVLEYVKSKSKTYGEALQLANKLYVEADGDKLKMFIAEEVRERLNDEMLALPIKNEAAAATTAETFTKQLQEIAAQLLSLSNKIAEKS